MRYFPEPREDETLYSIVARIQQTTGWSNGLMGREYPFLAFLPTNYRNLDALAEMLPEGSTLSKENLLLKRTTFGAMTFGLPDDASKTLRKEMCVPGAKARRTLVLGGKILKECPECVKADTARYGEAHWRRIHQAATVTACPIHGCRLHGSRKPEGRLELPTGVIPERATGEEIKHAITVSAILDGLRVPPERLGKLLLERLVDMGLTKQGPKKTRLDQTKFNALVQNQTPTFLKEIGLKTTNWNNHLRMTEILNGRNPNPRKALCLVFLTQMGPDDLLAKPKTQTHYPCRNRLGPCHREPSATPFARRNQSTCLKCEKCGYEYIIATAGLPANTADRDPDTTSHHPGPVWEAEFRRLWMDPHIKNKDLWDICGLGRSQTERQGARLGLPKRDHAWWVKVRKSHGKNP